MHMQMYKCVVKYIVAAIFWQGKVSPNLALQFVTQPTNQLIVLRAVLSQIFSLIFGNILLMCVGFSCTLILISSLHFWYDGEIYVLFWYKGYMNKNFAAWNG